MDLSKVSSNIAKVNFKDIISKYDHIFFDCDGVIVSGREQKGQRVVEK